MTISNLDGEQARDLVDVVCVGAGFAGLYTCYRLVREGFSVAGFEAADGVGGTWRWNRYPGARCDIESHVYSYSFSEELQQEWRWSERYASQPEILRYLEHVADRFDLLRHFTFNTRVVGATWLEVEKLWSVELDSGRRQLARFLISCVGVLSTTKTPDIPGFEDYSGRTVVTGTWDIDLEELAGKRVGVIGTGSSAVQCIPLIADVATEVTVFQRTPNFVMPARNAPVEEEWDRWVKARYPEIRAKASSSNLGIPEDEPTMSAFDVSEQERMRLYAEAYKISGLTSVGSVFKDLLRSKEANETAAEFLRGKVRETVTDPVVAEALLPKYHAFGAKRTCFGTNYYETFNRENVNLVNLRATPITTAVSNGIYTTSDEYELDVIVLATGFDAVTGSILRMNVATSTGETLVEAWEGGPRTYLGLMTSGFPNFFMIIGPQSPSIFSNVAVSVEQHVDWVADLLTHMRSTNQVTVDAEPTAEDAWGKRVEEAVSGTLYASTDSWYRGSNIEGKPNSILGFVGGVGVYRQICDEVARDSYRGFLFGSARKSASIGEGTSRRQ